MKKIVSFDIFDTCLVRTTGSPDVVFELLAKAIVKNVSLADIFDFIKNRKEGEYRARIASGKEEVSIEEIYEQCDFSFVTNLPKESIISKELEIEESVLVPVLNVKNKIDNYRKNGYNICFISDMYLPEFFILKVLTKYDFYRVGDRLYLSSMYNATKSSGNLYKIFKKDYPGANIFNWKHHGDNIFSDFINSAKQGAFPILISHNYNKRESIKVTPFEPFLSAELNNYTSISKGLRLSHPSDEKYTFAVDTIAPMYVAFTLHILKAAKNKGISDLFFFARDGYLFYIIAQQFQEAYKDLKFHYIYVSRKVIYYSTLPEVSLESLKSLFSSKTSLSQILDSLFLKKNDLTDDLLGILSIETERDKILEVLCADNIIFTKILTRHKKQKEYFLKYLKQVGLISNITNSAIVDLRGTRKSHELLNDFFIRNGFNKLFAFYYEVTDNRVKTQYNNNYYSCIFKEQYIKSSLYESLDNFTSIFEQYFSVTSQQRTSYYQLSGLNIEPVFENDRIENNVKELFEINKMACLDFCQHAKHLVSSENTGFITRLFLSHFLTSLSTFEKELLKFFEGFVMSENQFDKRVYVKKLSFSDFRNHKHIMWFKGSIILTFGRIPYYLLKSKEWLKHIIFK